MWSFSQRVRTFDDALDSSQINCVDGSVLFASLLRSINIDPILVRTPGHMFVGYYTDNSHKDMNFLETTMIGDVDLDDFFPDEQLDSTMVGKSQNKKFISPGAWFSINYPSDWNEFEDGEGSFLFYNPDEWTGNFRISAFKGKAGYGKEAIRLELKENDSAIPVK